MPPAAIAAHPSATRALIEVDCGEHRGGVGPDDAALLAIAARLGPGFRRRNDPCRPKLWRAQRGPRWRRSPRPERAAAVRAAERLAANGRHCPIVSMGSSPTALHAAGLAGITEVRAGVYMFGDLFQAEIGTHGVDDIAVTVLTSVIGRRPGRRRVLVDAGGLAASKDRSTEARRTIFAMAWCWICRGAAASGRAWCSASIRSMAWWNFPPRCRCRICRWRPAADAPNHTCMTAAAHDRYFVVDGDVPWSRFGRG